jgi:CxxC motif-containing protein (DUF1111 family)
MNSRRVSLAALLLGLLVLPPTVLLSQRNHSDKDHDPGQRHSSRAVDPGPRPGAAGAGTTDGLEGYFPTLNAAEQALFLGGFTQFVEVEGVPQSPVGTLGNGGLGPGFNSNSCGSCHSQPAILGSSPAPFSPQVPQPNPEIAAGQAMNATNVIPSFITPNGPVREARFVKFSDGTLDGSVHNLFSIAGRTDAPGCNMPQPDFASNLAANNVVFRIPTPVFGDGLVENTLDSTLEANLVSTASQRASLGIRGRFNRSGNTATITKFGWKAQNPSLDVFAGEAYNVEMGITNDNFPMKRNEYPGCVLFSPLPEDSHLATAGGTPTMITGSTESDIDTFADVMRLSAPPTPAPLTADTQAGQAAFEKVGCNLCHSESLTTGNSIFTGMSNVKFHPFSDFALHHMGTGLADGVNQGLAGPDEFRTAPLWGIGQRLYFLHDGRTQDLLNAIEQHSSQGSEANGSVQQFNALSPTQQQQVLDFLRSL